MMNSARRKAVFLTLGMAGAAALAHVGTPTKKIADQWPTHLEKMFPSEFGDWHIDRSLPVILPAPDVQAKLDAIYNQVLARTYVHRTTGHRVMLSVAYGGDQSDGMQMHLPEVCYPAQGFALRLKRTDALRLAERSVPVQRLVTVLGSRNEPVTYWMTIGEAVAATRTQHKLRQLQYGLRGYVPDGMLVRVSSIDRDVSAAFAVQDGFLRDLAASIPVHYQSRVLGSLTSGV